MAPTRSGQSYWRDTTAAWLAWLRRCGDQFHASWNTVRPFAYGLWIARASTASVLAGALLFYGVQPAQDLFLGVRDTVHPTIVHWLLFYSVVVVAWVFPIYLSARWVLTRWNRLAATQAGRTPVDALVSQMVPPVLAAACLLIVFAGQLLATNSAPSLINNDLDSAEVELDFQAHFRDACPNVAPDHVDAILLFYPLEKSHDDYSDLLSKCNN